MAAVGLKKYPKISEQDHFQLQLSFRVYINDLKNDIQQLNKDFLNHTGEFNTCFSNANTQCQKKYGPGEVCLAASTGAACDGRIKLTTDLSVIKSNTQGIEQLLETSGRTSEEVSRYILKLSLLEQQIKWVEEVIKILDAQEKIIEMWKELKKSQSENEEKAMNERFAQLSKLVNYIVLNNGEEPHDVQKFTSPCTSQPDSKVESKLEEEYCYLMKRIADFVKENMLQSQFHRIENIMGALPAECYNDLKYMQDVSSTGNEADNTNI